MRKTLILLLMIIIVCLSMQGVTSQSVSYFHDEVDTLPLDVPEELYSSTEPKRLVLSPMQTELAKTPDDFALLVRLGDHYCAYRDYENADAVWLRATQINGTDVELWWKLVQVSVFRLTNGLTRANSYLHKLLATVESNPDMVRRNPNGEISRYFYSSQAAICFLSFSVADFAMFKFHWRQFVANKANFNLFPRYAQLFGATRPVLQDLVKRWEIGYSNKSAASIVPKCDNERPKIGFLVSDLGSSSLLRFHVEMLDFFKDQDTIVYQLGHSFASDPYMYAYYVQERVTDVKRLDPFLSASKIANTIAKDNLDVLIDLGGGMSNNKNAQIISSPHVACRKVAMFGYFGPLPTKAIDIQGGSRWVGRERENRVQKMFTLYLLVVDKEMIKPDVVYPDNVKVHSKGFASFSHALVFPTVLAQIPHQNKRSWFVQNADKPSNRGKDVEKLMHRHEYGIPMDHFVFLHDLRHPVTIREFKTWFRILQQSPKSILWLIEDNVERKGFVTQLVKSFDGSLLERVLFGSRSNEPEVAMTRYSLADLYLDSFVVNDFHTAVDCLWVGLPVLTAGELTMASRTVRSVLTNFARDASMKHRKVVQKMIAESNVEYVKRAVDISKRPGDYWSVRRAVNAIRDEGSPLFSGMGDWVKELKDIVLQGDGKRMKEEL